MKDRITVGLSSIVLIFLVLCLAVFCLLSLSDARSSLSFAERHAASVQIYYEADASAQTLIRDYRTLYHKSPNAADCIKQLSENLPDGSQLAQNASNNVTFEFPMRSGQTLFLELGEDGENIFSYYVYNTSEYVIDSHLPVYGGD